MCRACMKCDGRLGQGTEVLPCEGGKTGEKKWVIGRYSNRQHMRKGGKRLGGVWRAQRHGPALSTGCAWVGAGSRLVESKEGGTKTPGRGRPALLLV